MIAITASCGSIFLELKNDLQGIRCIIESSAQFAATPFKLSLAGKGNILKLTRLMIDVRHAHDVSLRVVITSNATILKFYNTNLLDHQF